MTTRDDRRLLAIGLDGATFDVIRPMVERDELPCLKRLIRDVDARPLHSTVPPITPPAWSSFATGVVPRDHGVFGFSYPASEDYARKLTSAADRERVPFWQTLQKHGCSTLLIDLPFTWPPQGEAGTLLAGFPIPESEGYCHPDDLVDRLSREGIACRAHPNEAPDPTGDDFLSWLDRLFEERTTLFDHLSRENAWRFAMIGTMALDWAQHALWKYFDPRFGLVGGEGAKHRETLLETYRRVDRFVERLLEIAGKDVPVLIVSDHGFGTTFHYDWVAQALEQAGLLVYRKEGTRTGARLAGAALKAARSSARLKQLGRRLLGNRASAARDWARSAHAYEHIDWQRTRVFPAGDYNLNLYVNSRSRFADGIVGDDEVEDTIQSAVEALETFRPPGHSQPLVHRFDRPGGTLRCAPNRVPDLSLELTPLPLDDAEHGESAGLLGFHHPEGILISSDREVLGDSFGAIPSISDLAPAILKWFAVEPDASHREPDAVAKEVSEEGTAQMLDRLRDMGYID